MVTLDCASGGIPKPVVTWGHNSKRIQDGGRFKTESIGKLNIRDVRGSDAGSYACIVRSEAGEIHRSTTLIVKGMLNYTAHLFFDVLKKSWSIWIFLVRPNELINCG